MQLTLRKQAKFHEREIKDGPIELADSTERVDETLLSETAR
jgi:hypothetical protein